MVIEKLSILFVEMFSCHENPVNCIKKQKDMTLKDEAPRSECVQYATGEEWRTITNSSKKNEVTGPKQKQCSVVDVSGDESIGTSNVRSMNQGELDMVRQEMARVNIDVLRISEIKWTGMGEFNSEDHYIYFCGQESHRRKGVALIVNKSLKCST